MSFVRRLDMERLWAPIVAGALVLTSVTLALLLFSDPSAPASAPPPAAEPPYQAPPAAEPSYQAADGQVPSDPAEVEHKPADQAPRELPAPYQNPDVHVIVVEGNSPPPDTSEDSAPGASEQSVFKTRRALETIDSRELLRQGAFPPR